MSASPEIITIFEPGAWIDTFRRAGGSIRRLAGETWFYVPMDPLRRAYAMEIMNQLSGHPERVELVESALEAMRFAVPAHAPGDIRG